MNTYERVYNLLTEVGKPETKQDTAPQSWKGEGAKKRKFFNMPTAKTVAAKRRLGIKL